MSKSIQLVINARPEDLSCILRTSSAYRWQRANKRTREAVWNRLCEYASNKKRRGITLTDYLVETFISLECDDLFYPNSPVYTVRTFLYSDGGAIENKTLRQIFTGPGAYEQALKYSRYQCSSGFYTTIEEE